jgi:cytochrome b561
MREETATTPAYSRPARVLHWTNAALVLVLIPVGFLMTNLGEGKLTDTLFELHKSFGLIALAVILVRLAVRLVGGAPEPHPGLTGFERSVSQGVHKGLYVLLFLMPILGWVGTSAGYPPVNFFWTVPVTFPIAHSEAVGNAVLQLHVWGAFLLTALVLLHLAGALNHALIKRDGVLQRMLPKRG